MNVQVKAWTGGSSPRRMFEIIEPVCIRDGLSDETIAALKADFVRSYEIATMFKP